MADDPTRPDDPFEQRLEQLGRLRGQVAPPPPVHELTARTRQRRSNRFALAAAAAAIAAVIAGVAVFATRPDGDSTLTAGGGGTTAPATTTTTSPLVATPTLCGASAPTASLADHDLELTPVGEPDDGRQTMRLTNRGDEAVTVGDLEPTLARIEDGKYRSMSTPHTPGSDSDRIIQVEPGGSAEVTFWIAGADCDDLGRPPSGSVSLTPIMSVGLPADVAATEPGVGVVEFPILVGEPIEVELPPVPTTTPPTNTVPESTTMLPPTTTIPGPPATIAPTTTVPSRQPGPTTTIPAACAPTVTVAPEPTGLPPATTTTRPAFCPPTAPEPTIPPTTTTIPR